MAIHPIVVYGEPVLHRKADPVVDFDDDLRTLVADMFETLKVSNGVGLAAPQIGVGKQIFVYDADDEVEGRRRRGVFINPILTASRIPDSRPHPDTESEGCLSVPSLDFPLKRANKVTVNGFDENGERISLSAEGWFARIMQHEFDHLQGTLYVDRLDKRWTKKWTRAKADFGYGEPGLSWLPGTDPDPFGHEAVDEDLD
ncbi:peptide deformylase [Brevibacterium sp. HMSC08F02]|uniref:Peptide deformylase n=1 Tax=Brevibacterium ravenspurgense TaxID=479117 RepID=A0A150HBY8_9MICO|nr:MULTISPECIES: peptide deformylase [Brevibacterium]KXZ59619.1 Peptide deformylase [Brevibacterium ravenspurgense]MCG7301006.1 peptide deformylase [Brevibacterium ravenspurgense]OFT26438.1 peptide deformylase [Brevibacterium sp. HMSC08F02]